MAEWELTNDELLDISIKWDDMYPLEDQTPEIGKAFTLDVARAAQAKLVRWLKEHSAIDAYSFIFFKPQEWEELCQKLEVENG